MKTPPDDAIRAALAELREEDARDVPSFAAVVGRGSRVAPLRPRWTALATVAAAAALAILAAGVYRTKHPPRLHVPREVIALSGWTAPTDILLAAARQQLVTQAPTLGASIVDTLRREFR